jgi:hypothetical protein
MRRRRAALIIVPALLLLSGCILAPTPSPSTSPTAEPSPSPSPSITEPPSATATPTPTATPIPTATPEPALSLDLPDETDDRVVAVSVDPQVSADGGRIVVTVTSHSDGMVEELVLRWPRGLSRTLHLRPFEPSGQRIAEGGPPLVQEWTKWVLGPGEEGEPAGTISLGWGPLFAGATLTIPVDVVRRADGPVAFDLQVLSDNAILTDPDGEPVEIRVRVP